MNILQLKHNTLGNRYQMPSDGGTSGGGDGGSSGSNGGNGNGGGDNGGNGFGGGFGVFGGGFNPAKDSQAANMGFGNEQAYGGWLGERTALGNPNSGSMTSTWGKENPGLSGLLGYVSSLFGGIVAGPVGSITAKVATTKIANDPSLPADQKASAIAAIGNLGEDAFSSGLSNFMSGKPPGISDNALHGGGGGSSWQSQLTGTSAAGAQTTATTTQTPAEAAAAANKDPVTLATSIANQSWSDWQGDKAALQKQVDTNTQRGNALYDSSMAAANGNMRLVDGMQSDYNNIYRPAGQQFSKYVGMLGSQDYQDKQAGSAMADVQHQSSMQQAIAQRNLQRSGVNPSSGRAMAMNNQNAIGTAAAMANAGNTSRRNTTNDWAGGLVKMSDMGNATLSAAKGLDSSAQSWNTLGMNAGNTGFGQSSDLSKLSGFNASTSGGVAGTAANALYGQGALANANTNSQIAKDAANPLTTIGGAIITNAAKGVDWSKFLPSSSGSGSFASMAGMPSSTDSDPLSFLNF